MTPQKPVGRPRRQPKLRAAAGSPREEITAAAVRLFVEKGYVQTTMSDIAREVGLNQSSVYYWFERKEAILQEAVTINRAPLDYLARIESHSCSPAVQLYRLLHFDTAQMALADIDFNEIETIASSQPESFTEFWDDYARLHRTVAELIEAGIASEQFVDCEPHSTATTALSVNEGMQKRYRRQTKHMPGSGHRFVYDPLDADEWAHLAASTTIRSLLRRPDEAREIRSQAGTGYHLPVNDNQPS
ncbi:hypothetical protein R1CP_36670 (plasmid) [Rhodococcus opacus]|uniref:HTH tetR-type domain-containing protein n=1 Tax=Rhodococcus opacus TaxID=37919 RepID=A0A1B1KH95_RHOOP|nr:TetR/AcrR family transcriptional regulator [Rhodococcus opacus]ANS31940.1 hypothetical protein R1CP_36670 [Rhodococcus opacus]